MRKKPGIRNNMLAINIQPLAHPYIVKLHAPKSRFQSAMQLGGRKRNRRPPLTVLLPPQRYIDHETIINYLTATAHER
jgi:hypothetical protein